MTHSDLTNSQASFPPPLPPLADNPEASVDTGEPHHTPTVSQKKRKKWFLPLLIVVGVAIIGLPVLGIIAAIAIPNIQSIKEKADESAQARLQSQMEAQAAVLPESVEPLKPSPAKPMEKAEPSVPPQALPMIMKPPVDLVGVNLKPDSPVWRTNGQKDLRDFLVNLWEFDKLADDPFYDLSETILTHILEKNGPIDDNTEMFLLYLPRKIDEYPHLGCAALSILSPNDREVFLQKLEPLLPGLNDPILSLQVLAHKSGQSQSQEVLDALKSALAATEAKPLSDAAAFHLLSDRFLYSLPRNEPEKFIEIVQASPALPQWLKDYKTAETLWVKFRENLRNQNIRPVTPAAMQRDFLAINQKLEASWKANPEHPAAAALMIEILNGKPKARLNDYRKWFDRAIDAQADHARAHSSYLKILAMKESPENPLTLKFGRACAATERFDTMIPMLLIDAHVYRAVKLNQSSFTYWASLSDSDKSDLEALFSALDKAQNLTHDGVTERSLAAVTWFLIGDKQKSANYIKKLGSDFDANALNAFQMTGIDKAQFKDFLDQES